MREIPVEKFALYGITIAVVIVLTPFLNKLPRTRGDPLWVHGVYVAVALALLFFVPEWVQDELFSPGGVLVVGTIIPIYESIVAVCSIGSDDDAAWLAYWVASGVFSFATEFMDDIAAQLPEAGEHWYEFEFFLLLWLALPMTDGTGLIYCRIIKPYVTPLATKVKMQLDGLAGVLLTAVNMSYLWFMLFWFVGLPEGQKRFIVVAIGTVYPLAASTVTIATSDKEQEKNARYNNQEERFWLTYWCVYSLLFIAMDYLENFVGQILGFYTLCGLATLYLFLPMFQGADVIFRRVLVPLSGQYENMLLFDAYLVRMGMEASIPSAHQERVLAKAAKLFHHTSKED